MRGGTGLDLALRRHGPAALVYGLLAIIFTYPTAWRLGEAITGVIDAREYLWNLWWVERAVLIGENPFHGIYLFHPLGLPLYFHTLNPLNGVLSLPIQALFGLTVAYNVMNIFWFAFAAVAAYALAWYLTGSRAAAFVAGLIYGFSPYMAFHLWAGQVASLTAGTMPLYLLFLLKGVRERWPYLLLASLLLLLIGLSDWHYLAFSVTMTGLVALYEAVRLRQPRAILLMLGKCLAVGLIFLALFSPVLVPMILEYAEEPYARRPLEHSVRHSADLLAFWLPSIFHPLWGDWADTIFDRLVPSYIVGGIATLGYVALALGLYAAVRDWRRSALFVLLFIAGFLLSLGPYLQIGGVNSYDTDRPIPMPFLLFRQLPFMEVNRFPSRFVVVSMLALAMLAAIGVQRLLEHPRAAGAAGRRAALLALAAGLVLFEFWPMPFPMDDTANAAAVSPFYRELASDPADYAILEVPNLKKDSMFFQTFHQKRIVGGRISRETLHEWWDARIFGPLIQHKAPLTDVGADESVEAWRAALACQNVRYVVFYKQDLDRTQREGIAALERGFFGGLAPAYEDDILRAYGPLEGASREPYWTPGHDWYEPEPAGDGSVFRWIKGDRGTLLIYPCGQRDVTLSFEAAAFAQPRTLEVSVDGRPAGSYPAVPSLFSRIEIPLTLGEGETRVELRSVEPPASPESLGSAGDQRLLSLHFSRIAILPR